MKKVFAFVAVALALVDGAAYYVWRTHKAREAAAPAQAQPAPVQAPVPQAPPAAAPVPEPVAPSASLTPGGCMSPEACAAYCSQPANMEECARFSSAGKPPEPPPAPAQLQPPPSGAGAGDLSFAEKLRRAPSVAQACLRASLSAQTYQKLLSGQANPSKENEHWLAACLKDPSGAMAKIRVPTSGDEATENDARLDGEFGGQQAAYGQQQQQQQYGGGSMRGGFGGGNQRMMQGGGAANNSGGGY